MVAVRINGDETSLQCGASSRFTELVELVKSIIDPDHIITDICVDGRDLSEGEWQGPVAQFGTSIVEIQTGRVDTYLRAKMSSTPELVNDLYLLFRQARKSFQCGSSAQGNQALGESVRAAKAFFEWYSSMLQLAPVQERASYDIEKQVIEIGEVCKKICQQQLYQSWWALGETIEKELEPKLDQLETFCRRFQESAKAA